MIDRFSEAVSNCQRELVVPLVIQRVLRHANVGVTRQSYIKIEDRVKTAAMRKLQGSLRAKIKARKAHKKNAPRRKK